MTQEEKRAQIIAAQAARQAEAGPIQTKKKPRPNWAASPAVPPARRGAPRRDGNGPGGGSGGGPGGPGGPRK